MTESIEHKVDRSGWDSGPWDDEPDREEWRAHGMPCLIVRASSTGALCGYVGVPPGHPLHGKSYGNAAVDALDVHGGITFGDKCGAVAVICHVPLPGEPDAVWWLGFDCSHAGDSTPQGAPDSPFSGMSFFGMDDFGYCGDEDYCDIAYVRTETEKLAAQLAEMSS